MKKVLKVTIIAISIFFSIELSLYALNLPHDYRPHSVPVQFKESLNPDMVYTSVRSTSIDFVYDRNPRGYFHRDNTVQQITNSAGFRGPEISFTKIPGSYRVIFLGDSRTFGEGVYFEDTFPEQFKKLGETAGLFKGKPIDAVNMGVGGYWTAQEYAALLEAYKDGVEFDRVIVQLSPNDAGGPIVRIEPDGTLNRLQTLPEALVAEEANIPWYANMFRSLRIINRWILARKIDAQTLSYTKSLYDDNNPNWLKVKETIANFSSFSNRTGIPVTFVIVPQLYDLKRYPYQHEMDMVKEVLDKNHIPYIDMQPIYAAAGYDGPELWVHPTDQHPNEIADRLIAQALVSQFYNTK